MGDEQIVGGNGFPRQRVVLANPGFGETQGFGQKNVLHVLLKALCPGFLRRM
jgi:hypothetical protein